MSDFWVQEVYLEAFTSPQFIGGASVQARFLAPRISSEQNRGDHGLMEFSSEDRQ